MNAEPGCNAAARTVLRELPHRRGAALMEFGLVLPILVVVVFGVIDFARFAHSYIAITNAARAGADFGSLNPFTEATRENWQTQVQARVAMEMASTISADGNTNTGALKVTVTRIAELNGMWRVRVEASYPFRMLISWPGLPAQTELKRVVEMRGIR